MDAPRPAPATTEAGKKASQQRAAPKKRRQAVAGGSTVLAALFCLFIYCGIGIPRVGVPTRELKHPIFAQPKALEFETGQGLEEMSFGGRALQAAESQGKLLLSWCFHASCCHIFDPLSWCIPSKGAQNLSLMPSRLCQLLWMLIYKTPTKSRQNSSGNSSIVLQFQ